MTAAASATKKKGVPARTGQGAQNAGFSLLHFVVCEDVRAEVFGKLSYLGVFGSGIRLADASLPLQRLALVFAVTRPRTSNPTEAILEITHIETKSKLSAINFEIPRATGEAETAILYFILSPVKLELGTYAASMLISGHGVTLSGSFSVTEDVSLRSPTGPQPKKKK